MGSRARDLSYIAERSEVLENGCWQWTGSVNHSGYGKASYQNKSVRANRLAFFFKNGYWPFIACHTCGNNSCVNPDHIYDGNYKTNHEDQRTQGKLVVGEKNKSSKLTEEDVFNIINLKNSGMSKSEISRIYGVSSTTIYAIFNGRIWSHISGIPYNRESRSKT